MDRVAARFQDAADPLRREADASEQIGDLYDRLMQKVAAATTGVEGLTAIIPVA